VYLKSIKRNFKLWEKYGLTLLFWPKENNWYPSKVIIKGNGWAKPGKIILEKFKTGRNRKMSGFHSVI
jgi:hypothetical protein